MANEFIVRKGLIVSGSAYFTETVIFAGTISGSVTSASYAESASWAPGAFDSTINRGYSGSFTGSLSGDIVSLNSASIHGIRIAQGKGSELYNTAFGSGSLRNTDGTSTPNGNTAIGHLTLSSLTTGNSNTAIGSNVMKGGTAISRNTAIGASAMSHPSLAATDTVALGYNVLPNLQSGAGNVVIGGGGTYNYASLVTLIGAYTFGGGGGVVPYGQVSNSVAIGAYAGNNELESGIFYIDALSRGSQEGGRSGSLMYGRFNVTSSHQTLRINASVTLPYLLKVDGGITGSLFGSSSYALSASYAPSDGAFDATINRGYSGSFTGSLEGSASYASNVPSNVVLLDAPNTGSINLSGSMSTSADISINGITFGYGNSGSATNLAIGANTLKYITFTNIRGINNIAIGKDVMPNLNSLTDWQARDNTGVGYQALYQSTIGANNTAIGSLAAYTIRFGNNNTAIGASALGRAQFNNEDASSNTAIGAGAMYSMTSGNENTAVGTNALGGEQALMSGSVAVGFMAGYYTSQSSAFIINNQNRGSVSGDRTGSLMYGVFHTIETLQSLRINAAVTIPNLLYVSGNDALINEITIGRGTKNDITNTAIGYQALLNNSGSSCLAIGYQAMTNNVGAGSNGDFCIAIGYQALAGNFTSGNRNYNIAIGYQSMVGVGNGSNYRNTAIGYYTIVNGGTDNTAIGHQAIAGGVATDNNTGVGSYALANTRGGYNTAIGRGSQYQASYTAGGAIVPNFNTSIGYHSLYSNLGGSGNITIGAYAGYWETGSNQLFITNNDHTDISGSQNGAIIWGQMNATPSSQTLKFNANVTIPYSLRIDGGASGSFTGSIFGSSSYALSASWAPGGIPDGAGIVSSSDQVVSLLPIGVVSSSTQASAWSVGSAATLTTAKLINGTSFDGSSNIIITSSYSTLSSIPTGIISSSTQLPTGIFSSSVQLPGGTVSSSTQIVAGLPVGSVSQSSGVTIISSSTYISGNISSSAGLWLDSGNLKYSNITDILTLNGTISSSVFSSSITNGIGFFGTASYAVTQSYVTMSVTSSIVSSSYASASATASFFQGAPKWAWGRIVVNASSMSLNGSYGIFDIKKIATGSFEIHWATPFTNTAYCVTATAEGIAGTFAVASMRYVWIPFGSQSVSTCSFQCTDDAATTHATKDASAYNILAFGI